MLNSVVTNVSEMAFYIDFPQQKKIPGFQKHLGFTTKLNPKFVLTEATLGSHPPFRKLVLNYRFYRKR